MLLFADQRRLAYYADGLERDGSEQEVFFSLDEGEPIPDVPVERALEVVDGALPSLEARGLLVRGALTLDDPWMTARAMTTDGTFRYEETVARRIRLAHAGGGERAFWWSDTPGRHLILWEDSAELDGLVDRSRDHTLTDRFTLLFFREIQETLPGFQEIAVHGLDELARLGADVSAPRTVRILYRVRHVCEPVSGLPGVLAVFGAPIAVWGADAGAAAALAAATTWEDAERCLHEHTDALFAGGALAEVAEAMGESHPPWDPRALLAAAHRLGVPGAYAYVRLIGVPAPHSVTAPIAAAAQRHQALGAEPEPRDVIAQLEPLIGQIDARLYPAQKGELHRTVARAYEQLGDTDLAFSHLEAAVAIRVPERDPIGCGVARVELAKALVRHRRYEEAEDAYRVAVDVLDPAHLDDPLLAFFSPRTADDVAELRFGARLGLAEALLLQNRELGEVREILDDVERTGSASRAAMACLLAGELAERGEELDPDARGAAADAAWRRGLDHLGEPDTDPGMYAQLQRRRAHWLNRMEAYGREERLDEAQGCIEAALAAVGAGEIRCLVLLTGVQVVEDRSPALARKWAAEALELARTPQLAAEALAARARVEPGDAAELHEHAAEAYARAGDRDGQIIELRHVAEAHAADRSWEPALDAYERAIAAVEGRMAGGWADRVLAESARDSALYPAAALCAVRAGRHERAFLLMEGGRARFLKRYRADRIGDYGLDMLLQAIPAGGAVVSAVVGDEGTAAYVVPAGAERVGPEHVLELPLERRTAMGMDEGIGLAWWVNAYLDFLRERDFTGWEAAVDAACDGAWSHLMGPLMARLQAIGVERGAEVVCAAPNLIAPLPLHAARAPDGSRPFVDHYRLSFVPSLAIAAAAGRAAEASGVVAAIDPQGDLPFAAYERAVLEAHGAAVLAGPEAMTEDVLEACRGPRYLHFACHAINDWRDPHFSKLVLADGALGVMAFGGDPVDLEPTRLVVLSACETGVSTALRRLHGNTMTGGGEEFVSLPAAMLAAGAGHVLSTLWPVEDYPAALFVEELYRRLFDEQEAVPEAVSGARGHLRTLTAAVLRADVERRLAGARPGTDLHDHLEAIQALLAGEYAPDETPLDHPGTWGAFVLSGQS